MPSYAMPCATELVAPHAAAPTPGPPPRSRLTSTRVVKDDLSPVSQWLAPIISLVNRSGPLGQVSGNRRRRGPPRAPGAGGDVDGPRHAAAREWRGGRVNVGRAVLVGVAVLVRASTAAGEPRVAARRVDGKPFRLPRLSPAFPFFAFGQVLSFHPASTSLGARTSGRIIIWTVIGRKLRLPARIL
jgi:hypothetical protein